MNHGLRGLALIAVFCLGTSDILAQRGGAPVVGEVHGQVRYAQGGQPAERILVRLEPTAGGVSAQVLTDSSGKFQFTGLLKAQYIVSVRAAGFREVSQRVDLKTLNSDYLQFQLVAEKDGAGTAAILSTGTIDASIPAEAQNEYNKGRTALLEGKNLPESRRHLEKAIKIHPAFIDAHLLLGTALMEDHQWEKAEKQLRHVLDLSPGTAQAWFALGETCRRQSKLAEAEKALLAGLKLDEKSWQGHFTLGRVYLEINEPVRAGPEAGRALQLKPDLAEGYLLAGNILLRAKKPENALPMFEEYLRLAPKGELADETRKVVDKIKRALK